jgi:ribonuclease D
VRLDAARTALAALSERVDVPTENLVSPDLVRRLCWDWVAAADPAAAIEAFLHDAGARQWQCDLVVPVLAAALS